MIGLVAPLSVAPGMQIDCLLLLLVIEYMEHHSGMFPPGLTIVSAASLLVVGCIDWLLGTPGMMSDKFALFLGSISVYSAAGVLMSC